MAMPPRNISKSSRIWFIRVPPISGIDVSFISSQPIKVSLNSPQDRIERDHARIIQPFGLSIFICVKLINSRVLEQEGLIFRDTSGILLAETLHLTLLICLCAYKLLHPRISQQTIDVIIMPQEIYRESPRLLLLPKFGRYGLKFFYQCIGRMTASNLQRLVIDEFYAACCGFVQRPCEMSTASLGAVSSKPASSSIPGFSPSTACNAVGYISRIPAPRN